jgi:transposase
VTRLYIGLDVHSKQTSFAIQTEDGKVVGEGSVPTTPGGFQKLRDQFKLAVGTIAGLETGTVAFYAARVLGKLGFTPLVIDAREVRNKARRKNQKCDRRDALDICHGVRTGAYQSIVHVPPESVLLLRETLSRRRHFVRMATSEVNAVRRLLRSAGLRDLASVSLTTDTGWKKLTEQVADDDLLSKFVKIHFEMWQKVKHLVAQLEVELDKLEKQPEFAEPSRRLQTISGVGPIVALTALAVLSDIRRFASPKQAASYAGIVPATFHSGDRQASGHITKRGSAELRAMLCEAAHHAALPTNPLNPFFTELCCRRGYKMAITAVAHRLLRIIYAMLRDGSEFDVSKVPVEVGPFKKTREVLYRRRKKTSESVAVKS